MLRLKLKLEGVKEEEREVEGQSVCDLEVGT
jgi:hypothetical protein